MFALLKLFGRRKASRHLSARCKSRRHLRLGCEPLERRELLSATIAPLPPHAGVFDPVQALTAYDPPSLRNFLASTPASEINSGSLSPQALKPTPSGVPSSTIKGRGYVYYRYGYTDLPTTPTPGLALEGGGTDIDQVYQWMGARAKGGDFLVLGTAGKDAYDPYIYNLNKPNKAYPAGLPLNSVSTLVITSSAALTNLDSKLFVLDKINRAEAIFIEGGDQSTYVNLWQGTPIQDAINAAAAKGDPIGGTSAGLAVLGQYIFSAENGSAYSSKVLANPYDSTVTLDQGFLSLPAMNNVITDSHFYERDRMGRLDAFLARLVTNPQWTPPSPSGPPTPAIGTKGIGIDEQTALLVDLTAGSTFGDAQVVGNPTTDPNARRAYFLETTGIPQVCLPNTPLTYTFDSSGVDGISVHRAALGDTFNLSTWTEASGGIGSADYTLLAVNGVLSSTQSNHSIY